MEIQKSVVLSAAIIVAAFAVLYELNPFPSFRSQSAGPELKVAAVGGHLSQNPLPPAHVPAGPAAEIQGRLNETLEALKSTADPSGSRSIISGLRAYLASLPASVASREIQFFLVSGADGTTRLNFSVQRDGTLEASSLRVFLLEQLGALDPAAAESVSRQILNSSQSPDEWAVGFRNYARVDQSAEGRAFVHQKLLQMVDNPAWRENPTAGFLEAFDAFVYTHATGATPALSKLVSQPGNPAVSHAAFLALDRLTLAEPQAVLSQLQSQPESLSGREAMRSNLFARADIRDPGQKQLLETYLLDPRRTLQELNSFAGIYPNANFMVSNNLLTSNQTPSREELQASDRAAFQTVQSWLADPRFSSLKPQLETIRTRLESFAAQSESGR